MRVSRSIRDLAYHSMQAREELQKQNGREPKHIRNRRPGRGLRPENVAMALESAVAPTSLYEPVYSDGEDSFPCHGPAAGRNQARKAGSAT